MPPKPKYTKDEIAAAAFEMIKSNGLAALTARDLGKKLGTSASPIFTVFENMDEVKLAAREIALEEFKTYINDYREYTPAFKRIGMMMVSYGMQEPELFKLLFMQEHKEKQEFRNSVEDLGDVYETCLELICSEYGLVHAEAALLFEQLWTQAFGLGAMCAMGVCRLNEEEIGLRLGISFASVIMLLKSGRLTDVYADVEKQTEGTYHGISLKKMPFVQDTGRAERSNK